MQDAFSRDMFNTSDLTNARYNGHVQITSFNKGGGGGKKDRKGCTKGKIEAIMKNNSVRPKICVSSPTKKAISPPGKNHVFLTKHQGKLEPPEQEDPYTFTEPEPHSLSLYQASSSIVKKIPAPVKIPTMVCIDKGKPDTPKMVVRAPKTIEGSSKMNKLQADIARNKVIGKRKKVEQIPTLSVKSHEWMNPSVKKDSNKVCIPAKREPRRSSWQRERNSKHELLERIHSVQIALQSYKRDLYPLGLELSDSDSDESENAQAIYEKHWFSRVQTGNSCKEIRSREKRVADTRAELRRKLAQTLKGVSIADTPNQTFFSAIIKAAKKFPNATAAILDPSLAKPAFKANKGAKFLITGEKCSYSEGCNWQALPCTRHCSQHIMYNVDQRLFSFCMAKFSDNTQCSVPVFDIRHDLPLCHQHSSQADSFQKHISESRSHKKVSKKSRVLGISRTAKRNNKKRKKSVSSPSSSQSQSMLHTDVEDKISDTSVIEQYHNTSSQPEPSPPPPPLIDTTLNHVHEAPEEEVSEEVLEIANLDPVELANQATRLLEEHDLTNMLNQISTDAFNDIFAEDKNGEYEPTKEETEELERALEAVNQDVRSLERMTRALPLLQLPLDSINLLDEPTPSGPFPTFQNGFPPPATTDIHPT